MHDDDNNNGIQDTGEMVLTKNIQDRYREVAVAGTAAFTISPRGTSSTGTISVTNTAGTRQVLVRASGLARIQ